MGISKLDWYNTLDSIIFTLNSNPLAPLSSQIDSILRFPIDLRNGNLWSVSFKLPFLVSQLEISGMGRCMRPSQKCHRVKLRPATGSNSSFGHSMINGKVFTHNNMLYCYSLIINNNQFGKRKKHDEKWAVKTFKMNSNNSEVIYYLPSKRHLFRRFPWAEFIQIHVIN